MNKENERKTQGNLFLQRFAGKTRDVLLVIGLGLALIVAAWQIFHKENTLVSSIQATETETKVLQLLEEIDGVGEASVIIYEGENGVESVVVVCEGARSLQVTMNIREAVSAALGTEQNMVKIYLKKE